jgi:hypothetical protein
MESKLENEVNDMTRLFTTKVNPAVRTPVLKALADPGADIGYGNWMNLCRPCLFTFAYFEATGQKELPKNFSEQLIADALGIQCDAVVFGAQMWDEWNKLYPQARELFLEKIRDFQIDREFDGILIDANLAEMAK